MNDIILILIQLFIDLGMDIYPATIVACVCFSYMFIGLLCLPYTVLKSFNKYYIFWFDDETYSIYKGNYFKLKKKMFEKKHKHEIFRVEKYPNKELMYLSLASDNCGFYNCNQVELVYIKEKNFME